MLDRHLELLPLGPSSLRPLPVECVSRLDHVQLVLKEKDLVVQSPTSLEAGEGRGRVRHTIGAWKEC